MTITAVKQFTIQPRDTFETLRQRLTKGDRLNPNTTSELVFLRSTEPDLRWDSVDLAGATAFSMSTRGEPFLRYARAAVSQQTTQHSCYDTTPFSADHTLGFQSYSSRVTYDTGVPLDEERDGGMQEHLRSLLLGQRAINRQFQPMIEAARERILEQWLAGHGESKSPNLNRAGLHVPAMEYLQAMGLSDHLHVLPVKMARTAISSQLYSVHKVARSEQYPVDTSVPKKPSLEVQVGDVVHGGIGDYVVTAVEHLRGKQGRECVRHDVRYLYDGRTDVHAFSVSDWAFGTPSQTRVLGRI